MGTLTSSSPSRRLRPLPMAASRASVPTTLETAATADTFPRVQPNARLGERQESGRLPRKNTPGEIPYRVSDMLHVRPKDPCMKPTVNVGPAVPDRGIGHRIRPALPTIEMPAPGGGMRLLDRLAKRSGPGTCNVREAAEVPCSQAVGRDRPQLAGTVCSPSSLIAAVGQLRRSPERLLSGSAANSQSRPAAEVREGTLSGTAPSARRDTNRPCMLRESLAARRHVLGTRPTRVLGRFTAEGRSRGRNRASPEVADNNLATPSRGESWRGAVAPWRV